jgi:N-acetylneuraminic acid mutarotase
MWRGRGQRGGGSTATPVTISNLTYSPKGAYTDTPSGSTVIMGSFDFSAPSANVASVTFAVLDSAGHTIQSVNTPLASASGQTSGQIQAQITATTTTAGKFTFDITVINTSGGASNMLSGTFTVNPPAWVTKNPGPPLMQGGTVSAGVAYGFGADTVPMPVNPVVTSYGWVYDPMADAWNAGPASPTGRWGMAVASVGTHVYAIGGMLSKSGPGTGLVEILDTGSNTWTTGAPMPTARAYAATVALNGRIYIIGGDDSAGTALATIESYDPVTNTWTKETDMPTARALLSAAVINNKIFALGGESNGTGLILAAVESYDPSTKAWTQEAPMPAPAMDFASAVVNGQIYTFGGRNPTNNPVLSSSAAAYDPVTNTWAAKTSMPSPGAGENLWAAVINGNVLVFDGGGMVFTYIAANEIL